MIKRFFNTSLFRSASVYTLTQAINSAIPFLLMPILTRYLTPTDYGIVAMFGVLLSFVAPFTGLSIHGAIARQHYDRDEVDMPSYVTNCLLILLSSTVIVGVIFYFLAEPISRISSFPMQWMWAVIVVSAAQFINQINLTLWQVQVKPVPYGIYQIAQTIVNLGFTLWFIVGLGMDWQGRIQAQVIAFSAFAVFGLLLLYLNGWIKLKVNKDYIKNALNFGVPLIPHALSGTIKTMVDRVMITGMVSVSSTGLYSVGFQIGMIIGMLEDSFNQAYVPWLYERLKKDEYSDKIMIVKLTYAYFVGIICLALALGAIAPWFLSFFVGPQFVGSGQFVLWIALGFAFDGMYKMVVNYIFYMRKTYILAWVTFSTAIGSIVINYFAIKYWGAIGAAYTYALVGFITFLLVWFLSGRVYHMPWNLKNESKMNVDE
jgi:O-antigen/teichoic acid export membrane protein